MADDFQQTYEEIIRSLYGQVDIDDKVPAGAMNYLKSPDGTFLGKLTTNRYDPNGIFNPYGQYGSRYSNLSIFNHYGQYGSRYSGKSPYSRYANEPPEIYLNKRKAGYLTINPYKRPSYDPDEFLETIENDPKYRY